MQFAQHTIRTLELSRTIFALSCSCLTSAEPISELQLLGCIVSMVSGLTSAEPISELQLLGCIVSMVSGRTLRLLVPLTLVCVLS